MGNSNEPKLHVIVRSGHYRTSKDVEEVLNTIGVSVTEAHEMVYFAKFSGCWEHNGLYLGMDTKNKLYFIRMLPEVRNRVYNVEGDVKVG